MGTETLLDVLRAQSAVDCDTFDLEGKHVNSTTRCEVDLDAY